MSYVQNSLRFEKKKKLHNYVKKVFKMFLNTDIIVNLQDPSSKQILANYADLKIQHTLRKYTTEKELTLKNC